MSTSQASARRTNDQVMFSTTLEVEKQLQQVIKQLYEKVSLPFPFPFLSVVADQQATTSVIV
jgi:hypothetical protein